MEILAFHYEATSDISHCFVVGWIQTITQKSKNLLHANRPLTLCKFLPVRVCLRQAYVIDLEWDWYQFQPKPSTEKSNTPPTLQTFLPIYVRLCQIYGIDLCTYFNQNLLHTTTTTTPRNLDLSVGGYVRYISFPWGEIDTNFNPKIQESVTL